MPERIQIQASTICSAGPDEIYALLANSATYPLWSMIRYYESLRSGHEGLHDVGALRLFRTNAITVMREQITDVVPNERVGYTLLSGFPLLDYRSRTTLEKMASGTRIVWESSFYPKYPLTAWYWRRLMTWVLGRLVRSLAETAEDPERRSKILSLARGKTSMWKRALPGDSWMNGRNTLARILVALGATGWFATAVLHLKDYPEDTAKLSALSAPLQAAFRTVFLMVGWDWIVVAVVALLAAFTETTLRKLLVLFCGVAGLFQAALALALMGVFLGTELMFPAAILLIVGGLLFDGSVARCPPSER